MELKVQFVETNEEMTVSFDGAQEVLVVDDTSIGKYPWSSKHTVEKLCPPFEEKDSVVQCEPIEGYPLKVVTELETEVDSLTLTICGKNLYNCANYALNAGYYNKSTGVRATSSNFYYSPLIPVRHLRGKTITLNLPPNEGNANTNAGLCFYTANAANTDNRISGDNGKTHTVPANAEYMGFSVKKEYASGEQVQIEIGEVSTEYEAYRAVIHTAQGPLSGQHEWSGVKAVAGINTIWSSTGETKVTGVSDPVAFIEKLTNAVLALGGNI